jgi:hypothetical protein
MLCENEKGRLVFLHLDIKSYLNYIVLIYKYIYILLLTRENREIVSLLLSICWEGQTKIKIKYIKMLYV